MTSAVEIPASGSSRSRCRSRRLLEVEPSGRQPERLSRERGVGFSYALGSDGNDDPHPSAPSSTR